MKKSLNLACKSGFKYKNTLFKKVNKIPYINFKMKINQLKFSRGICAPEYFAPDCVTKL